MISVRKIPTKTRNRVVKYFLGPISGHEDVLWVVSMKECTIVGSDKGGVGKSEVASLLYSAMKRTRGKPFLVEIDHQAKLKHSALADDVTLSIKASANLAEISRDRYAAKGHFDDVYQVWSAGDSITDLGANVTTSLLDWFKDGDIANLAAQDDISFRFVAVTSPDAQAIRSACEALVLASNRFPKASLYLVKNDLSGAAGFSPFESTKLWTALSQILEKVSARVIDLPYCDSKYAEFGRTRNKTPDYIFDHLAQVDSMITMTRLERAMHRRKLVSWLNDVQIALAPLYVSKEEELA